MTARLTKPGLGARLAVASASLGTQARVECPATAAETTTGAAKGANATGSVEYLGPAGLPRQFLAACPPRLGRVHRALRLGQAHCSMYSDSLIHRPGRCDPVQGNQGDHRREEPALVGRHGFGSGTVVGVAEFAEVDVGATLRCPVQAAGHVVEPLPDAHEIQIEIRPGAIRQLDRVAELVVAVDRTERELDGAPGSAQLVEEELGAAHHGLRPGAQTATREAEPVVQLAAGSVVVERLRQVRLPGRAQRRVKAAEFPEQTQVRLLAWAWLHMRDKFFELRPAVTDPGELPTEDRHRPGDPNSCVLESLAQPAQSRHAAARRPWSMHTQDERCSPVEPDVQVEIAADVLPRPGRRDLIEQRRDRGVIGAGPWPEPAGQWWRWCQSLGPSSRSFAGSIPSAGRNSMPGRLMFCVSAFKAGQLFPRESPKFPGIGSRTGRLQAQRI